MIRVPLNRAMEADCPICGGLGLVKGYDWVEHVAVPAGQDCDVCGGSGKLPILHADLLKA